MGLPILPVRLVNVALAVVCLAVLLVDVRVSAAPTPTETQKKKQELEPDVEVRCTDGSVLKLKMLEVQLILKTPYGKLTIPFDKVNEVVCATRIPEDVVKEVGTAITDLGSDEMKKRDAATAELTKLRWKAYSALLKAEKDKDAEVVRRARYLLEKLRKDATEEQLEVRERDIVNTVDSKITGQIEGVTFKVNTDQFGEAQLKLSNVRSLRALSYVKEEKEPAGPALPNPGHLHSYQAQIGKTFSFHVVGGAVGSVWGTDVYTLDSSLAVAAVHAGVLQVGKAGVVKVKILPPRVGFVGSIRNGVSTTSYAQYPGAYEFVKK